MKLNQTYVNGVSCRARASHSFSFVLICGLLLLAAGTATAQTPVELRCRGGHDPLVKLFVIDVMDEHNLSLNFNWSEKPAGNDSSGLQPATCSWIDRTGQEDDWNQLHFEVTGDQAESVPAYLKNRNNFYSFFVVRTDRGYFEAKSHKPWTKDVSVNELRCRGGDDPQVKLFVIDRLDAETLSLNFNSSKKPAGADSSGLEPATCSWIDRTVRGDEWRQIHFKVTGEQASSIPAYLKIRDNYWSFFVVNTEHGYFEATTHTPWQRSKEH